MALETEVTEEERLVVPVFLLGDLLYKAGGRGSTSQDSLFEEKESLLLRFVRSIEGIPITVGSPLQLQPTWKVGLNRLGQSKSLIRAESDGVNRPPLLHGAVESPDQSPKKLRCDWLANAGHLVTDLGIQLRGLPTTTGQGRAEEEK
jgi:hypothetical protein